ncbi:hypothetical protein BKH46_02885 [Helicobacter sp. 12S02634-8]|uniref:YnfA family protein n=1 Tax=Helicobacter sp. 12S02634-8 TaxID=1476199 RepID=UPI000BA7267E|nr:YnfA family protein [Helicobacter sp. 12S02634-8]PAF47795.1 hypothetical protein BKH46_02885 [Helicobacter sp. 12S02634-8]
MGIVVSVLFFLLACVFEVGGGYLVWIWLKGGKPLWVGLIGGIFLVIYGLVATLQTQSFGRVFAGYGGFFIVFSLLWAYAFDGFRPDRYDVIGSVVILLGVGIMLYMPRNHLSF